MNIKLYAFVLGFVILWITGLYWIIVASSHMSTWSMDMSAALFGGLSCTAWTVACGMCIGHAAGKETQ